MASSRGSTASPKPPKQRLAVTAQSATSKPWFTCSQPNSISCFQTEIVATHAKQRRTLYYLPEGGAPVLRQADRTVEELRRPGGDRDGKRAADQRGARGAGTADRDRRGAAGH